jgi:hypothetical protein
MPRVAWSENFQKSCFSLAMLYCIYIFWRNHIAHLTLSPDGRSRSESTENNEEAIPHFARMLNHSLCIIADSRGTLFGSLLFGSRELN